MQSFVNRLKCIFLNRLHLLTLPQFNLPDAIRKEYDEIYETQIINGNGALITFQSDYPKYQFLNYLIETKDVLVHGSNFHDISKFEPREQSLFTGKPVKAVFAASDAVWSLYFAVMNRKEYAGSLRNLCLTVPSGKRIRRYYYFSISKDFLGSCWVNGTIYILPKEKFKQGGIKDEWISEEPLEPLSKMLVTPDDFPFKEGVRRHSETDSIAKSAFKTLLMNK